MTQIPTVALLLDHGHSFDRGLLRGITRYVNTHRPWSILRPATFYQLSGLDAQRFAQLRHEHVDGLISNQASSVVVGLASQGLPTIVAPVDATVPGAVHLWADNRAVAIRAADHLIELGLEHFAFAGLDRAIWSLQRKTAFCQRLDEQGFATDSFLVPLRPPKKTLAVLRKQLLPWLDALPKPVGVMACNDEFALSVFELCRLHDIHVPEEVSLVGVDNDELVCELTVPQLTSVAFVTEQAGYEAAAALDRLMADGATEDDILVPAGRLVRRASTDVLAVEDEEVSKALRFVRLNAHRRINVGDVVEATFISQWSLGQRFRRQLGHSVRKEINRRRAEHIARLLLKTDLSVDQIALETGHPNQAHLARFFSREMGLTPREYRKR